MRWRGNQKKKKKKERKEKKKKGEEEEIKLTCRDSENSSPQFLDNYVYKLQQ